jgi:hypothetical protein
MKRSILFFVFFSFAISQEIFAQFNFFNTTKNTAAKKRNRFTPYSSFGIGGGHSNYYGELANYSSLLPTASNIRWNASIDYTRQLSYRFAVRFGFSYARLFADDYNFINNAKYLYLFARNYHFRNDVKEFSVSGIYSLVDAGKDFKRRNKLTPYLFAGIGVFAHNPEAKTPLDLAGYNGQWVNLQPLHTEGQGLPGYTAQPYSLVQLVLPYGLGLRYKIGKRTDISFELGYRLTFTDYIDDVGGLLPNYKDLENDLARAMSYRSLEAVAAYTQKDRTIKGTEYISNYLINHPGEVFDPAASGVPGYSKRGDVRGTSDKKDSYLLSTLLTHTKSFMLLAKLIANFYTSDD